ncbi:hypothetical protein DM806_17505 [Sphingobium lactosutens]|uniref:TauD/TfdA dioxygenase family protein n=1 Tax=Sphingobium lactosutens TaxID=522773 RepID=UPI0015BDDABB|nr:TauD/TfdA family dioxygenase [Sphingobium lactosutens]NWK97431.1 hypothetical protein [Sphingobium lactosutens]
MASTADNLHRADEIKVRPLPRFGVEVEGVDISQPLNQSARNKILYLADNELLLVFRNQPLNEDQFVAFSEALGNLIPVPEERLRSLTNPLVHRIGNVGKAGETLLDDDPETQVTYAAELWHSDGSYKPVPNYLTALTTVEVPPVGGGTMFASMVAAYEALPQERKAFLADKAMEHPYPGNSKKVKDWEGVRHEVVAHPIVRELPNGKRALFFSPWGGGIVGMSEEKGRALLKELLDFSTGPEFVHEHSWRPGDTVLWNNRGLLHAGSGWDRKKYRRLLLRTEFSG